MMNKDLTVIYYTNNREKPNFVRRVIAMLRQSIGDLPLISVSQQPMDLGHNICVGDVGSSTQNTWRQFQIGAMQAKTRFVCTAEADCLYPPEYFQYEPELNDCIYCARPMWAIYARSHNVRIYIPKKFGSFGASMMGRESVINAMEKVLEPHGTWGDVDETNPVFQNIFQYMTRQYYQIPTSIVSFKTDQALHHRTPIYKGVCTDLPEWGEVHEMIRKYLK